MKKIYLLLIILFSVFSFCQTKKSLTLPSLNAISIDSTFQIKPIICNLKKNYDFNGYTLDDYSLSSTKPPILTAPVGLCQQIN